MASDTKEDNHFLVMVYGVEFYETDDELIAGAIAHNYRTIGWKDVKVKGERI